MRRAFRGIVWVMVLSLGLTGGASQESRRSEYQLAIRDSEGKRIELYKASYALVIGIDHYTNGWPDLPGVVKDIDDVSTVLIRQGFLVTIVRNPDRAKLLSSIDDFIGKNGHETENRLLFYFAGHGHTIRLSTGVELGYIVPANAANPNVNQRSFKDVAIDMQQFENIAQRIECKHVLFLFDSCFSGSIFDLSRGAIPAVITYKTAKPVRQFITSGSADELVPDKSIFKSEFLNGIEGEADLDKDGFVTGTELGEFLLKQVVSYSKGTQHPQYGKIRNSLLDKGDFVFSARPTSGTTPKPDEKAGTSEVELEFWKSIKDSAKAEGFEAYLKKFPDGVFSDLAKNKLQELRAMEKTGIGRNPLPPKKVETEKVPGIKPGADKLEAVEPGVIQLTIKVNFPSDVYFDGEFLGEIPPLQTKSIAIGSHNLEFVSKTLSKKLAVSVQAVAGQNLELKVFIDRGVHQLIPSSLK